MSLDDLIRLGLLVSIWLIVLSLGARASANDALYLARRPGALARALAAMFVAVPAFAVLLAAVSPVPAAIKFAIVAMSVGPVPPILPFKQVKAGGEEAYALGLLVAAAVASVVLTPLLVMAAASLLGAHAQVGAAQVARTVALSIGLPLAAGMALRATWRSSAERVARLARGAGGLLLIVVFVLMVAASSREILGLFGDGAAVAIAATVAVALLAGHLLAGRRDSGPLALAAATRHPGVALAIAELSYPDQRRPIIAAILLYLLITLAVTAPYVRWSRRRAERERSQPSPALGEA